MERLTERDGNCFMPKRMVDDDRSYCEEYCHEPCDDYCPLYECFQKLAEYEDAEEQGRLIEFPVAIGDYIYEVIPIDEGQIRELSVKAITLFGDGTYLLYCTDGTYESYFNSRRLGTLMFPTRGQAEAKLKELEAENGQIRN